MIGNIYNADWLIKHGSQTQTGLGDGRYVAARPINYKAMTWLDRLRAAVLVFQGKYDLLEWTDQ